MVYFTVSPTFGFALSKPIVVTKLALVTFIVADKTSPFVVGSAWSPAAALVLNVMAFPPVLFPTVAIIFNVLVSPVRIPPMVQIPVVSS